MHSRTWSIVALLSELFISAVANAQSHPDQIAPLPTQLSQETVAAFASLSPTLAPRQITPHRRPPSYFFQNLHHPLTPRDVASREAVRSLGTDAHRFVRCDLKDHSSVTGAITSIGDEHFFVKTGILGNGSDISYGQLSAAPRPVTAAGTHLKNGVEWTGFVAVGIALFPLFLVLGVTGIMQD